MDGVFHCSKLTSKISHVKYFNKTHIDTDFMVRTNHTQMCVKMIIIVKQRAVLACPKLEREMHKRA